MLEEIDARLVELGAELGAEVETFQSNDEGAILDFLEDAADRVGGFVVNAGALTHTSIALRDGLVGVGRPFVEVHLSNIAARERFRRHSFLTPVALGAVYGFGVESYLLGLRAMVAHLDG